MSSGRLYSTLSSAEMSMEQQSSIFYATDDTVLGDSGIMTFEELGTSSDQNKQSFFMTWIVILGMLCKREINYFCSLNCCVVGSLCYGNLPSINQHTGTTEGTVVIHLENLINRYFTLEFCRKNLKAVLKPPMDQS